MSLETQLDDRHNPRRLRQPRNSLIIQADDVRLSVDIYSIRSLGNHADWTPAETGPDFLAGWLTTDHGPVPLLEPHLLLRPTARRCGSLNCCLLVDLGGMEVGILADRYVAVAASDPALIQACPGRKKGADEPAGLRRAVDLHELLDDRIVEDLMGILADIPAETGPRVLEAA